MRIVEGFREPTLNKALAEWCAEKIGARSLQEPYSAIGVFEHEDLKAVLVYNNYHAKEGVVEVHGAATTPRWLTRPVLYAMYDFPFNRLGCQTVIQRNDPNNRRLARMLLAYGFKEFRLPRLRGRGKDESIFILHDDVWRANGYHKEHAHG